MIIDASKHHHEDYQEGTITGALAHVVEKMKDYETIEVEKVLTAFEGLVSYQTIRTTLNQLGKKMGCKFKTKSMKDGKLKILKVLV